MAAPVFGSVRARVALGRGVVPGLGPATRRKVKVAVALAPTVDTILVESPEAMRLGVEKTSDSEVKLRLAAAAPLFFTVTLAVSASPVVTGVCESASAVMYRSGLL